MKQDNKLEVFPLVDEEGNVIGSATRGECHDGSKLLHPVVHLHVFNGKGELYLQPWVDTSIMERHPRKHCAVK